MEDVLSRVHKMLDLHKELSERIEKAQELKTVEVTLDTRTKKLHEEPTTIKSSLITDFNIMHTETQATRNETLTD